MVKIGSKILFVLLFSMSAWAEVSFDATVDQNQMTQEDILTLTLTISSDGDVGDVNPLLPDLSGFEIMNSFTQQQMSSLFQNGKFQTVRKLVYKYKLLPQQTGEIVIGPAKIEVNGQTLSTKPIKIKVTKGGGATRPQQQKQKQRQQQRQQQMQEQDEEAFPGFGGFDDDENDLFTQLLKRRGFILDNRGGVKSSPQAEKNAFFITVEANKKRAYVGEQIVAKWTLYTRGAIQSFDALKYPELKGFWKEDLEIAQRLNFEQEIINGVPYNKATLVSYALFPISPGKKTIDQFKAKATVVDTSGGLGVFGIGRPMVFVKSSEELPIDVIPLPTQGRPSNFSGAVGKFNITGSLGASTVKVNQPVSLKIKFSGRGNVKAIELPPLNLPSSLEVYDTKKDSQFSKSGDGYMEFEVLLIPRNIGDLTIPSIPLSFFDPQAGKYVTQSTPSFKLNVVQGDGSAGTGGSSPMQLEASPAVAKDVRPVKDSANFIIPPNVGKLIWFLGFLLPIFWLVYQIRKIKKHGQVNLRALVKKKAGVKIKEAKKKLQKNDWKAAGIEINNALLLVLGEIAKTGAGSKTAEEILAYAPQIKEREKILDFIHQCQAISFAPDEVVKAMTKDQKIVTEAEKIIDQLLPYLDSI